MNMNNRPNFFILGAAHAGTTSFNNYLKSNPEVFASSVKEPNFFSPTINKLHIGLSSETPNFSLDEYLSLFSSVKNEKIICDASTRYLYDSQTPKLIHEFNPDSKFLVILRDPIERIQTHLHAYYGYVSPSEIKSIVNEGIEEFYNQITKPNLLNMGCYSKHLSNFFNFFDRNRFVITYFENVFPQNVVKTVKDVLDMFDVRLHDFPIIASNVYYERPKGIVKKLFKNKASQKFLQKTNLEKPFVDYYKKFNTNKKKPELSSEVFDTLKEFYSEQNKELEKLIGLKPPWKNFT